MSARHGLGRSLLFAALAGAAYPACALLAGGASPGDALGRYLVGAAVLYAALGQADARRAVAVGAAAAALGLLALALLPGLGARALAAALVTAFGRGAAARGGAARRLVAEALLAAGSLAAVRLLAGPHPIDGGIAVWGFFLVQSAGLVLPGTAARGERGEDPFERAARALDELLAP
jgi:hypothetical protein